jgi:hypothetical protein
MAPGADPSGGGPVTALDPVLEAWVRARRKWTYVIDYAGFHVVRDPTGELMARNLDPAVAMEILERRQ